MPGEPAGVRFVRVLGSIQLASASGVTVDVPSAGQRRLLALLALHVGRTVQSRWLGDVLELSPGALRNAVSRLRRLLGHEALITTSAGYRLDLDVDAEAFSRVVTQALAQRDGLSQLDRALSMWTGRPFAEFEDEAWAVADSRRLLELHTSAVEERAAELVGAARWSEAIASLHDHVARHPFRDRPRGLLIRALAGAGRQADALRAYQAYRSFLADEVGTEPSADVRAIERRVAAGWDGGEPLTTAPAGPRERNEQNEHDRLDDHEHQRPPAAPIPLHGVLLRTDTMVGRRRELTALTTSFAEARTTGMRSVIVSGEAGIGKTTLLGVFARHVRDVHGANVLYGRCDEDAAVPMQPFVGLIRWLVEHAPIDLLVAHVAEYDGALLRLAPHLSDRLDVEPPAPADEATERYVLFEAVADVLRRFARRSPLVVILDDVHWAEPTGNQLLRALGRALVDVPSLLVVAFRDSGAPRSDELRAAIGDLDRGRSRRVPLGGLAVAELVDLVVSIIGADRRDVPAVAARLGQETAGNPLYAAHLLRHWVESRLIDPSGKQSQFADDAAAPTVPASLGHVLWSRVRALGPTAPEVVSTAAVLGPEFDPNALIEMLDIAEGAVTDVLDDAIAAGLLVAPVAPGGSLRFTHSLVWNAAYEELRPLRRSRLHRRAMRALLKSEDEPSLKLVGQLARHCELGGLVAEAERWAIEAGERASAELAPREAADWYRKALEHCVALGRSDEHRVELLVSLGEAQRRSGDPAALATLSAAADLAAQCGARTALVRAALATDRGFMRLGGSAPEQLRIVEMATTVVDPDDEESYVRLLALLGQCLVSAPHLDPQDPGAEAAERRERAARRTVELARASADPMLLARVARPVVYALSGSGAGTLRADLVADAIRIAEASADPFVQFDVHQCAYVLAIETADAGAARRSLARLRLLAEQLDEPGMRMVVGICDTFDAMMAARFADAERLATEVYELGNLIGEADTFSLFAAQVFVIGTFAGRHAELIGLIEQAMNDNPEILAFRTAYGVICTAADRLDAAREILAEGMAHDFAHVPRNLWWSTTVIGYAVLAIELEDADAAARLLPRIEPHAAHVAFNGVTSQGPIAAYVGKLASLVGRHDEAERHVRAALATATEFGWEYHRATALIDLARCRLRRDCRLDEEAHAWLDAAEAICDAHGIRSWGALIPVLRGSGETRLRQD